MQTKGRHISKNFERILWGCAFGLMGLAYVSGLFIDLTGDSGLYAAIARQMVESGDWLNLKINGEPYDQKPHLLFWLAGAGIKLFGNTNFAFKLFPVLWGLAGIYFTFRLGKLLFSDEAGKWAALVAGTSQIFFLYSLDIHTDTVLQAGVALALWQLAEYLKNKKTAAFIFGFLGVGLALLSKGPVGAVLPFFAVLFYLMFKKDFKQLFHPKWGAGVLIVLGVASPALFHLYQSFGREGLQFFFITNNLGRISGAYAGSSTDYLFYLHTLVWAFLPWTVFVLFSLFSEIKSWRAAPTRDAWGIYLLGSVLVLVLILSIARGKAPNYFLIAVVPLSVIVGKWMSAINNLPPGKENVLFRVHGVFLTLLVILFIMAVVVFTETNFGMPVVLFVFAVFLIFSLFKIQKNRIQKVIFPTIVVFGTFTFFLNARVIPGLFKYQGARQAIEIFEKNKKPGDRLCNFEMEEYALFFMAEYPVLQIKDWNQLYEVMDDAGTWLYTNETKYKDIFQMNYEIDTVYQIRQRGMNRISLEFLNPKTRENSLEINYLIKTK